MMNPVDDDNENCRVSGLNSFTLSCVQRACTIRVSEKTRLEFCLKLWRACDVPDRRNDEIGRLRGKWQALARVKHGCLVAPYAWVVDIHPDSAFSGRSFADGSQVEEGAFAQSQILMQHEQLRQEQLRQEQLRNDLRHQVQKKTTPLIFEVQIGYVVRTVDPKFVVAVDDNLVKSSHRMEPNLNRLVV